MSKVLGHRFAINESSHAIFIARTVAKQAGVKLRQFGTLPSSCDPSLLALFKAKRQS